MPGTDTPMELYVRRRARVLEALDPREVMVLAAAPEITVGRDLELRYVPDPDLWYLTGYTEPGAVAVLTPSAESAFTLFVRPRDPDRERWTGPRGGVDAAVQRSGADRAYSLDELGRRLPELLRPCDRIHFRLLPGEPGVQRIVLDALAAGRQARQRSGTGPAELVDPGLLLDEMRLLKDPGEVEAIREAVAITIDAFRAGLGAGRPGVGEWEVEAAVDAAMRRAGADGPAFATIAASGDNATTLHYIANRRRMDAGDLLLLDAGARHRAYNADLTRTVPVGGRFSDPQRDVYEVVLQAREAAIHAVRPGATTADPHQAALRALVPAMVELGLLTGDPTEILERGAGETTPPWKAWYPHNTSHWLGLDVHDAGTYGIRGEPRPLQPGMVLTIEPGLYIPRLADGAPHHLRGIGVRIEDDLLVRPDGAEILSRALPADAAAMEALAGA